MKSNKIYIIQMHTHTIPARLIKLATHYQYSHIAISLTPECDTIYSFGRRNPNSILNSGFVIENKNGEFFKKFSETICRIYEMDVTKKQYKHLVRILSYMNKHKETYKYVYFGIVLRFFKIPILFRNRYVCSFFVANALERANIYKFDKECAFVQPRDFENMDGVKKIYEGKYRLMNTYT